MKITVTSVLVDDQAKALAFYTDILGFQPKTDVPLGEHRWLTVVSADAPDGVELVLEPDEHPAAKVFKAALAEDGIPFTAFGVDKSSGSTSGCATWACASRRSQPGWAPLPPLCSTTPAAT